ncbi:MAG: hypothetical protein HYY39_06170 [Armatimonadetes bacterium]|nr:hypothetical protein [Armatimonadota bacterium]
MWYSRFMLVVGTATAILVLSLSAAYAQQPMVWSDQFVGQPAIQINAQPAYYIWLDQNGWHVRWSTLSANVFSGQLVTNGQFHDVRSEGRVVSWVLPQGGRLVFVTGTVGGISGFDFKTTGDTLTFSLLANLRLVQPSQVFLGRFSTHPGATPFTIAMVPAFAAAAGRREPLDLPTERHDRTDR